MPPKDEIITASRLSTFRLCQRKEQIRYRLGYRPVTEEAEALRFGTLVHVGLESWWKTRKEVTLFSQPFLAMEEHARLNNIDAFTLEKAKILLAGYDARWLDDKLTTLAVEDEFFMPFRPSGKMRNAQNIRLAGKMDVVVKNERGEIFVVEHKTTSSNIGTGEFYFERLRLDGQISMYMKAASKKYGYVTGVIYDVIKKIKLEPLKATPEDKRQYLKSDPEKLYAGQRLDDETPSEYRDRIGREVAGNPDKYFQRSTVVRFEDDMAEFSAELEKYVSMMKLSRKDKDHIFPRNPDGCMSYGKVCDYFGVCSGSESLADEMKFKKHENVHTELSSVS